MSTVTRTISRIRRAFTLIELTIALIVMSLVAGALAAVLTAVGQGWTASGSTANTSSAVVQTHVRLQKVLRSAKQFGACRQGSIEGTAAADLLIWKGDANFDYQVQFSELGLLEYTPGDGILRYYEVHYPSSWTTAQKTAADTPALANDEIYDDAAIDSFKAISYVSSTILARAISGAEFHRYDGASAKRPTLDYLLSFSISGTTQTEYGTVASRTPATLPASQGGT